MDKREELIELSKNLNIPTLPSVVLEINRLLADPDSGAREVGALIASDPGLAAKVLQVANSSYYGLKEAVLSAEHAATFIGGASLKNIALQASIMDRYEKYSRLPDFNLQDLWDHSLFVAQVCRKLAERSSKLGALTPEDCYTCGLLHDVGQVVLIDNHGEDYLGVIRHSRQVGQALHVCEQEDLGYTHIDVGVLVAARWAFPEAIQHAIAYHHGPKDQVFGNPAVAMVAIADQLAYRATSSSFETAAKQLSGMAHGILGLSREGYESVISETVCLAEEAEV